VATKKTIPFEASARLQRLIGRDLIPNAQMAIAELVKNGYDSGASVVRIFIQPDTPKEPSLITITDDGEGMSGDEIERLFMFAGYSERSDQVSTAKRIPTGEKGIGRFAADKLGKTLEVFTAKKPKSGIHLSIDWREFEKKSAKRFSDVTATYEIEDVSNFLKGKSGTVLKIGRLRNKWNKKEVDDLITWLGDLLNPFSKPKGFSIELEIGGSKRGTIEINPTPPKGNLSVDISVINEKVRRIVKVLENKKPVIDESTGSSAELAALNGLRARFIYFDKRPKKEDTGGGLPGVRVYRDGFRIEPFGSPKSDWLGVAEHRAKRAGHAHIVPSRLFGFVEISRKKHPDLKDTTSRQALLDTDAARNLVTVLGEGLSSLADIIRERNAEPRWKENILRKQANLEEARLHTLDIVASGLVHELRQPLQSIRTEADNITERLKQLGINDPDIIDSQKSIDRGIERIEKNISFVSDISKGNPTDLVECDLVELIKKDIVFFSNRCKPLGIEISLHAPDTQLATINELALSNIILNFIRNAMDAIAASGGKSIEISLPASSRRSIPNFPPVLLPASC